MAVPQPTEDVEIPAGLMVSFNSPLLDSPFSLTVNNLYLDGLLDISSNTTFIVKGILQAGTSSTLNIHDANLFVEKFATGNVTYHKTFTTDWYLITSPVVGETIEDIIATGFLATGTAGNLGLATYNNTVQPAVGWQYVNAGTTGALENGNGYSFKRASAGTIPFTGAINTANKVETSITEGGTGMHVNGWNLVGNPYAYSVSVAALLNTANNIDQLDPAFAAVYKWNGSSYDIYNLGRGSESIFLSPGESFFVKSKSIGGQLTFTKTVPSSSSVPGGSPGGDLRKPQNKSTSNTTSIKIFISDDHQTKSTEINYLEGTTTGLDVGYDAGVFSGVSSSFDIYTHLVSNDNTNNFAIQYLPNQEVEAKAIPIGIQLDSAKEVTFSLTSSNFDAATKIYLEDKVTNSFTRLDEENNFYKIQLNKSDSGVGRFYLHTSQTSLNLDNNYLQGVRLYKINSSTITLSGLPAGTNKLKLFSLLGKQVLNTSLGSNPKINVQLPKLSNGVYIVQLETEEGTLTKKIVID